ncbi:MAG: hypothetical protein KJO79_07565 [Verrucomicrobiae bacterium]|nr:hypothetical protein [Verrucomicrobiae bacterium]NNJ87021.1 hypothetical protein [Akkermansiaceae bacterium]
MMRSRRRPPNRKSRPSRVRNSRRDGRPSLRQAFHDANIRAKQRANRRMGRRDGLTSMQAAIAEAAGDDIEHLKFPQRMLRWLFAMLLLPFCIVTTRALFNVSDASGVGGTFWMDLIATRHFLYFSIGCVLMMGWFFTGLMERLFLYFYVLGHELTHAIFIYACGGKVGGIHVTADGGYVMTNKSNVLIALSPYFVPFWSVVVLILSTVIDLFFHVPHHNEILYFLIGFSWSFHLLWTLWMIPRDQPDLKENGFFFSVVIIYLVNVAVLSVILCLAPGNLTWHHWANEFMDSWGYLKNFIVKLNSLAY